MVACDNAFVKSFRELSTIPLIPHLISILHYFPARINSATLPSPCNSVIRLRSTSQSPKPSHFRPQILTSIVFFKTMGPRSQAFHDWLRRQKIRYLYRDGGPAVPSQKTKLYFDWRTLRGSPKQSPETAHPGTQIRK
jgi:hypothetical protein